MKKWIYWVLILAIVGGGVGFWAYKRATRPPEITYKSAPVERRSIQARVTASGTLQARVTVQVGSQVSGRVMELHADFNSQVKKGEIIAKLDPQLFEAAVARSRANFKSAQSGVVKAQAQTLDADRQYERAKSQRVEGLASQQEVDAAQTTAAVAKAQVDTAKSEVEQARAQLHSDEVNLALTTIKSPIDGVVISRSVDVGQTVAASLSAPVLFTIAEDLTKMRVEGSVPESDVGRLESGMAATFTVDAFPGQRFKGTISQVRNAATTVQNVVTYTAVIDVDNTDLRLRPGMTANVTIIYAQRDAALAVPNAALRYRPPDEAGRRGAPGASGSGGPRPSWSGRARGSDSASADGKPPEEGETKMVWQPDGPTATKPMRVRTGVTDGSYTELLGDTLHEGDEVIVEGVGAGAPTSGAAAPPGGARTPRLF